MAPTLAPAGRLEQSLRSGPGRLGLIPYLMAGHPDGAATVDTARRLVDLGVAAIELGIPCPEPFWDGPVIAQAGRQARATGTTVGRSLQLAAQIAGHADVPVLLMTYAGPLLAYGAGCFAREAALAGVAGVIVPDLDGERRRAVVACLHAADLDTISVVAPTAPAGEVARACLASTGFVYCTLAARTGAPTVVTPAVPSLLHRVRRHTSLPLVAGFGISRPEHLTGLRGHADAAVVGSALVAAMGAGRDVVPFVKGLLAACG